MLKILYIAGLLLYSLFIYSLSAQPSLPAPMWFESQDKLYHAGAYCILGALLWQSIKQWFNPSIVMLALLSIILGSLYGATDEWHQSFVPGRSPSVADWLADTIGVSLAVFCLHKLRKQP
ncbi:MAG: VanZ family protein [Methylovulum sp.]|nr:VanZ family protein [Methylovulum sp.]